MPRVIKIALACITGLLLILALCILLVQSIGWNGARPWVSQQLGQAIHRPVQIQGDLAVQWIRPKAQDGWRAWVPWPEITAHNIIVGNPSWLAEKNDMARADRLSIVVNPLLLLSQTLQISRLDLQGADIVLLRQDDGKSNWTLTESNEKKDTPVKWKFDLQSVNLQKVSVQVQDPDNRLDVKTNLDSLADSSPEGYGIGWQSSGSYNDAKVSGKGRAGNILSLQEGSKPFPLQADVQVGETQIDIEGSVTRPSALAALDVRLKLKGASMADLRALTGITLPNTPPYATEGRLIGTLDTDNDKWTYQDFKGRVGESDLEGTLDYIVRKPRSLLTGSVESKLLRFKDLGPLIGVQSSDVKDKPKKAKQPPDKALPTETINTASWETMDADVHFAGKKIVRSENLPLDDIKAHVVLTDSVLTLNPLDFGVAGGNLSSNITLDGQGQQVKAKMIVTARHLKLKKLLPGAETMKASLGELHGDAALSGQGASIAQLLGSSNGEVKAVVSKGTISHLLLETAGLNIANMVMVKLFGDEQVQLNCLASDFDVKNGLMQVQLFQLDTKDAIIDITGNINLANEHLNLDIKPANKSLRIFTLRTPLYVKGTFKKPDVGLQKGPLAARAGAAIALGVVATPLAALLPLLNLGTNDTNECAPLLAKTSKKPQAPPPGKSKPSKPKAKAPAQ